MNAIGPQLRDPMNSGLTVDPMAVDSIWMDVVAESGKNERSPRVSTRSSLGVESGRPDAGSDGLTCLARPDSQERTGIGENIISVFS